MNTCSMCSADSKASYTDEREPRHVHYKPEMQYAVAITRSLAISAASEIV
jgi:hypothetical protein